MPTPTSCVERGNPTNPPPEKRRRTLLTAVNKELGELIHCDSVLLANLGWHQFITQRRRQGDFTQLHNLNHSAKRLL